MKDPVVSFLEFVHQLPDHVAVVNDLEEMSYGELGSLVKRVATAIADHGNNPRVLIHLPQGPEVYAAMFGTLMAGGYYSPTNLQTPTQRQVDIFRQFRPDVVVSQKALVESLPLTETGTVLVDIDRLPVTGLEQQMPAHDLAYVMFTSGSTGQPKGVMIPRTGLSHYANWAIQYMSVCPQDRWSQHPNVAFDLSVLDIYGALCAGATLYPLTTPGERLLPGNFIRRHELTIWNSVPSVIDLMIRARQLTADHLGSLRLITFCGEPLLLRHLEGIFSAKRDVLVHNTYGPTEATVSCTLIALNADNYRQYCDHSVALGSAIPGMELLLTDGPSPDEGEVLLLGPQLARGYWDAEPETQRAFVSIRRGNESVTAYRTGDWVVRKDDHIYFRERVDDQIKIQGNRVELDEIDSVLFELGYGNTCTVFVNDQLHVFLETDSNPDGVVLRSALAQRLPKYEIPSHLHSMKLLPRNANDKIDRRMLEMRARKREFDTINKENP